MFAIPGAEYTLATAASSCHLPRPLDALRPLDGGVSRSSRGQGKVLCQAPWAGGTP